MQKGKRREPSAEELEFIFGRLHRGLTISEIKIDTAEQETFPSRGDSTYYRLRREFDAAKKVLWNPRQGDLGELIVGANKRHYKELLRVVKEWKDELGVKVKDPRIAWDPFVPNSFTQRDRNVGWHTKGPLVWEVTQEKGVDVWLAIEITENLFRPLLEHIKEEVGETYSALKAKLAQSIPRGNGRAVPEITNLTSSLSRELELIDARGIFGGTCEVCRSADLVAETTQADARSEYEADFDAEYKESID